MKETYNYIRYNKMSSREQPVIKFSPFEALLIGEKNKILKRQPMKNTIFVTRLNQQSKTINLRDLFGLEKSTKTENSDVIFKMPQRVCDFLKHRKLQNKIHKAAKHENGEILCYEFEGHKMITKNNEMLVPKGKNLNIAQKKIKFKQKYKFKDSIKHKVVKKFPNPTRRKYHYECKIKSLAIKTKNKNYTGKRHLLRGKDGKFICKKDYEKLMSKKVSPKKRYLSNYLHQLYLKKDKHFKNAQKNERKDSSELKLPCSVKTVVGLPNRKFDISAFESALNKNFKYYDSNCFEDFKFPNYPEQLKPLDFENDSELINLIYENFPKIVKFECQNTVTDFSCALLDSQIIRPEQNVKIYEKKKNGYNKVEVVGDIFKNRFPIIKLQRINGIVPNHYSIRSENRMYASKIDEPFTKESHLISAKSFGSFSFSSVDGKDIFYENLLKPFWQNSWFGSLPES